MLGGSAVWVSVILDIDAVVAFCSVVLDSDCTGGVNLLLDATDSASAAAASSAVMVDVVAVTKNGDVSGNVVHDDVSGCCVKAAVVAAGG